MSGKGLTVIAGIGAATAAALGAAGITTIEQLAAADAGALRQAGSFPARADVEGWIGQAKVLASAATPPAATSPETGGAWVVLRNDGEHGKRGDPVRLPAAEAAALRAAGAARRMTLRDLPAQS